MTNRAQKLTFQEAANIAESYIHDKRVNLDTKLMLYGYYKVATEDTVPRLVPTLSIKDTIKRKKWIEYAEKYSKDEAAKRYVALMKILLNQHAENLTSSENTE